MPFNLLENFRCAIIVLQIKNKKEIDFLITIEEVNYILEELKMLQE